jgi:hypothetical protein
MKRSTLILIGILALLIIATFVVLQRPGERSVSSDQGGTLVSYDSAAVDKIEVRTSSGTTIVQREGSGWMLAAPLRAKADDAGIHQLLNRSKTIALKALVSNNPQKQSVFQVDSTAALVKIFEGANERAAFRIGKTGPSYTETYVRREGSDDVYLADGMLLYLFSKSPKDWRDKAILHMPQETIRSVRFQYGDTSFALAFRDSLWLVDGSPASDPAVRSLLGAIATLKADDFVDTAVAAPPPLTAVIDVEGTQLRFHRNPQTNNYFVITSVGTQVFEIQGWHADSVLKRKKELVATSQ